MIIVDSSIWIDHFRRPNPLLIESAIGGLLLQHPLVTLELALGLIPEREATLYKLRRLPRPTMVEGERLLEFIEVSKLAGTGIGPIDVSILASAVRTEHAKLWTRDKRLGVQAEHFGVDYVA